MPMVAIAHPETVSIFSLFMQANWVVKLVMLGLIAVSIASWAIIINKFLALRAAFNRIERFEEIFWSGRSLEDLYHSFEMKVAEGIEAIFVASMREWKKSFEKGVRSSLGLQMRIDKAMDNAITKETERLESGLGFLATIGSAAPFIGLFGTVVGIMTSFQAISASKNTSLAIVAPGIAEALLATAIGLVAAIPAVIAYNKLSSDTNRLAGRLERFADEFSVILSRQIDEKIPPHA